MLSKILERTMASDRRINVTLSLDFMEPRNVYVKPFIVMFVIPVNLRWTKFYCLCARFTFIGFSRTFRSASKIYMGYA